MTDYPKYTHAKPYAIENRTWVDNPVTVAPAWCSVDLRDGNQSLPNPLTPAAKLEYFQMLCEMGFKHIEIAFPSASQDDFDFCRKLIDENLIPDDVFIMGLVQCREHLIARTFEAFEGLPRGIVHAYVATSDLHMKQVFNLTREQTIEAAVKSVKQIRELADAHGGDIRFEFSPEEFTDTDLDFALEICEAVFEAWGKATVDKPLIFNLPATVERRPPTHYADMIELFCRRFSQRDKIVVSLHAHNDQGMAVAASELALQAGADRVEGTLFGHGERTGNVDIVTLAGNLLSRGVKTGLDLSHLDTIAATVRRLTGMDIYYRAPYAGEYVFTAFSGSHQDAIRKGMSIRDTAGERFGMGWKVPYLHIDPADVGREYKDLIRINSQSGKGGVAWVLEQEYGLELPKAMHPQVGRAVQGKSDELHRELRNDEVHDVFQAEFVNPAGPYTLVGYWPRPDNTNPTEIHGEVRLEANGKSTVLEADGNGPIDAFVQAMRMVDDHPFELLDYHEQAVGQGADAQAIAYVPLKFADGQTLWGVGVDTNIDQAAVKAIVAALNRKA
ncbi:MAG: 2-isopropylmalate synthase [Phycisphaerales bacterium]|jgi:2-isopropylmalate synthase|nr:2-isopropylmalate synthase [Phycisphaerales bacterium]MBT7171202.1 2-isopropylmalate synthase [Phycisphaerales bacterium]